MKNTKVDASWDRIRYSQGGGPETVYHYLKVTGFPLMGLNGNGGLLRMHWTRRKRYTEAVQALVSTPRNRPEPFNCVVRVVLYRAYKARPMDPDNLTACAKPVLDALVRARIIQDDSAKHIELEVQQKPLRELKADWVLYLSRKEQPLEKPIA